MNVRIIRLRWKSVAVLERFHGSCGVTTVAAAAVGVAVQEVPLGGMKIKLKRTRAEEKERVIRAECTHCSESVLSSPVSMNHEPSTSPVVEKAQQLPQSPWSWHEILHSGKFANKREECVAEVQCKCCGPATKALRQKLIP